MDTNIANEQIITIDPVQYVAAVYAPFRERLAIAKTDAEAVTGMDVTTKEGMAIAVKHRAIFRNIRLEAEDARKMRKAPILTISKLIDGKYAELKAEIAEYEDGFDMPIKAEEARKELERTAAARELERKRIESEQAAKRAEEERLAIEREELNRKRAELEKFERQAKEKLWAEERLLREERNRINAERIKIEESKRLVAERERIRQEEQDKAQREAQAKIAAEQKAAAATGVSLAAAVSAPVAVASPKPSVKLSASGGRPSDDDIINVLALHYRVHELKIVEWLMDMNLEIDSTRAASEFV